MDRQQEKLKQREALENAYGNFVEPFVNQLMEVKEQSLPTIPIAFSRLCCVSGWLILTLFYCAWIRWPPSI
jgi:hypothetical protein